MILHWYVYFACVRVMKPPPNSTLDRSTLLARQSRLRSVWPSLRTVQTCTPTTSRSPSRSILCTAPNIRMPCWLLGKVLLPFPSFLHKLRIDRSFLPYHHHYRGQLEEGWIIFGIASQDLWLSDSAIDSIPLLLSLPVYATLFGRAIVIPTDLSRSFDDRLLLSLSRHRG